MGGGGESISMYKRGGHRLGGLGCWAVSAAVHAVCLGSLAFVYAPAGSQPAEAGAGAFSSNQAVGRVLEVEPTAPKPRLKPLRAQRPLPSAVQKGTFAAAAEERAEKGPIVPTTLSEDLIEPAVNFFGARRAAGRICFVVDCSGSMFGRMGLVRRQLIEAVHRLTPDQFFSIVFFGGTGEYFETGAGGLRRASPSAKQEAIRLIVSVRPGGRTDAMSALAKAMALRTPAGQGPDLIYFLTDGFDLDSEGAFDFLEQADAMRKQMAPQAVLHTIGFWTAPVDCQVLQHLADRSGGTFTSVEYKRESGE